MGEAAGRWPRAAAGLAAGLAGAVLGAALDRPHLIVLSALLAGCMAAITVEDARSFRVPDAWSLAAALTGLAAAWLAAEPGAYEPLAATGRASLQAVICGGAFLLLREAFFRLRGVEGLGLGDVKLAATGGIWLGWQLFSAAVVLAAVAALVWVAAQAVAGGGWPQHRKIPLGAFLAPAIYACWYGAERALLTPTL